MLHITDVLTYAVTVAVWMTPMPVHSAGWIVNYGSEHVLEQNAYYRGYEPSYYDCLGSLMSPSQLGQIFYLRTPTHPNWLGPCLSVDAGARIHYANLIYNKKEIAEVDERTSLRLGFTNGMAGEIWIGECPPEDGNANKPEYYAEYTDASIDWYDPTGNISYLSYFYPFPRQMLPNDEACYQRRMLYERISGADTDDYNKAYAWSPRAGHTRGR